MNRKQILRLLFGLFLSKASYAVVLPDPPELSAKGYILMDFNSGYVLAGNNVDLKLAPASLTKLMTAYVVGQEMNSGRLLWNSRVDVSQKAWSANFPDSSKMFIKPGDKVTVRELMLGLIVQSGNDAAVALAEHVAGDEVAFVSLMNGWAQSLGMENTQFINAHGLDGEDIATTPKDMALLMRAIIQDVPEVYELYKERSFTWSDIEQYNRNKLLWDRSLDVDGGKTGYTENAGYSLVASALEGKMRFISVVMGTSSPQKRADESKQLLSYGFRFFDTLLVAEKSKEIYQARIWKGESDNLSVTVDNNIYLTLPRSKSSKLIQEIELNEKIIAPVAKGEVVGRVIWSLDGEPVKVVDAVSANEIGEGSVFKRFKDSLIVWMSSLLNDFRNMFGGGA
ncbi:D-alanyl-D-alanine carboxypeptidase family protein [Vibrio renipiscarius]|uniref:serine-type D-Ala-D-Ala carboxypeptidase n=1 Tax=Vibrio renipiscarius TaxID=1461322 RepID=A0A0C2NE19_9VIBR|nr:D-alanyl-D-alanine carboxypeptidase family protein [Vibrio renipiscarius]KII76624.1 D-alanyl-D-alanine carboxypeptidase [Vibrio renipiscarius]KII77856.1 D-alanyl-D-alanine carboxypeptidase [Vibrio renipiscarius]